MTGYNGTSGNACSGETAVAGAAPAVAVECICADGSTSAVASCSACVTLCSAAARGGMTGYNGTSGNACSGETAIADTPAPDSGAAVAPVMRTPASFSYVNPLGTTNITTIINRIIRTALGFVGALFLAMFIYGGTLWMIAAGDEKKVMSAKLTLKNALMGIVVISLSYAIINILFEFAGQVRGA
ncbi:MAG: hypothetical protein WCK01_03890 [Candidatus Uhrbacteria bacterium]